MPSDTYYQCPTCGFATLYEDMKSSTSPTQRALKYFRERGGECVILAYFNKWAKRRIDIWGADILVRRGRELIAVQASDETSHGKHVTKAMQPDSPVRNWLEAEVAYYVYSEGMRGGRNEKKVRTPRITQVMFHADTDTVTQRELGVSENEPELELQEDVELRFPA